MTFFLIEPNLGRISGGLRYNAELLAAAGGRIERIVAPGSWPNPSEDDVRDLRELVARCQAADDAANAPRHPVLVDGLIGCSLSPPLSGPVVMLQHSLGQTPAAQHREAQCLRAASAVVTPSDFAAAEVHRRYAITAEVARPGTRAPQVADTGATAAAPGARDSADGTRPAHLICLGAMEDNKNQLFLAHVLQDLRRRGVTNWHCILAGPITDTDYAEEVQAALSDLMISGGRGADHGGVDPAGAGVTLPYVELLGELAEDAVDGLYRYADLLLLPSKSETFGMVVREAAAAAVPSFVTAGTGAEEALVAGDALPLDVATWAQALERWMRDETVRSELAARARAERESALHGWDETANVVLTVLEEAS